MTRPSLEVRLDAADFDEIFDGLSDELEAAVRPAAQAGAQVLYDAVKRNVASIGKVTGNLDRAIYQAFSADQSRPGVATYHVSWNAKKAPHGHLVEFGHIQKFKVYVGKDGKWYTNKDAPLPEPKQVAARPFIRPAAAYLQTAEDVAMAVIYTRLQGKT